MQPPIIFSWCSGCGLKVYTSGLLNTTSLMCMLFWTVWDIFCLIASFRLKVRLEFTWNPERALLWTVWLSCLLHNAGKECVFVSKYCCTFKYCITALICLIILCHKSDQRLACSTHSQADDSTFRSILDLTSLCCTVWPPPLIHTVPPTGQQSTVFCTRLGYATQCLTQLRAAGWGRGGSDKDLLGISS